MGEPFGTEVAKCPHCSHPIGNKHPYSWCAECGEPLSPQILEMLPPPIPDPVPTNLHCSTCGAKAVKHARFCYICGAAVTVITAPSQSAPIPRHGTQPSRLDSFETRLRTLEDRLPSTNLLSKDFWTRAFAVVGHGLAVQLALLIIIWFVIVFLGL
jgi:hypothetical protein